MKTVRQHMASVLAAGTLWLWRLLALVILLLAIVVSIGREIAPLLKDNKPWLEERLTRLSGYPVRMESAEGQWEGLVPQIQTTRLTMGDAVMLERALLRVDLLRSLLYRTLVFDALSVQGATLVIPVSDDDANQKMNLQAGLDFLFGSANIRLRDVAVYLRRETGQPLLIRIQSLDVGNASDDHWIQGMFTLADAKTPIELMGAFTGSASDILAGQGRAYVDVGDGSKLREVLAFARNKADLPVAVDHPGGVQGRVWLTWKDNRLQWQAAASLHNLKIIPLGYRLSYAGNLAGSFSVEGGLLASLSDVSRYEFTASMPRGEILINEKSYRVPDWGLHYRSADQALGGGAEPVFVPAGV